MPKDPPDVMQLFHEIRNLGRTETPHAWALDNARVLAEGLPVLLDLVDALRRQFIKIYNEPTPTGTKLEDFELDIRNLAMDGLNRCNLESIQVMKKIVE